ncbi:hypothetical protein F3Y22_tig00111392pilonHSYRG00450 [Hibiscus syriacus]|uniref:Uncharacterized protein n=1 Tax=Hibiscus syriacus TaxID=106335 RepID=A0A6A2YBK8_HIBSY|nr:hypothetical protein F3Y22_tig00111392pilonHSYRG00450 [Hibiscus syriacus]
MKKVDSNCVYRWISAAAGRGVKHLDLSIWHDESTTFPCVVYLCLLAGHCSKIMIDTPNLAYFKCSDLNGTRLSLENMQTLVEADIDIDPYDVLQVDAMAVFTGISNVHSLLLSTRSLKVLLICEPRPICSNLVELERGYCPDHKEWNFSVLCLGKCLLVCCLNSKAMEVSGFNNNENFTEKAKFIPKNGGALEKLTIRTSPNVSEAERLKMKKKMQLHLEIGCGVIIASFMFTLSHR